MDVAGWLRGLGLDQYEANFRDNKIDADVLPQLTADDLKEIGVSAVGDRRRLLAAIAALLGPTPSANAFASSPKPAPGKGLQIPAERRPITVMFCDLVAFRCTNNGEKNRHGKQFAERCWKSGAGTKANYPILITALRLHRRSLPQICSVAARRPPEGSHRRTFGYES